MSEKSRKLVYIHITYKHESGGSQIQKRNETLLRDYFGSNNMKIVVYRVFFPCSHSSRIKTAVRVVARKTLGKIFLVLMNISILLNRPDIVFADSTWVAGIWKGIFRKTKVIYFFHNIEKNYFIQQNRNMNIGNIEKNFYQGIVTNEEKVCRCAAGCVCINERDAEELLKNYGKKADLILKSSTKDTFNGKYVGNEQNKDVNDRSILFVGTDFFGNTEGLFWFIENCMEFIKYRLCVVGAGMEKYQDKYPGRNISFEGYVENLEDYYRNAECVVLPIISGSGMKTKTCEALMHGKIIIGTDEAFEGYSGIDETGCIRCNTKEEFVAALNVCYESKCQRFNETVRKYYRENYSNEAIGNQLRLYLDNIMEGSSTIKKGRDRYDSQNN